MYTTRYKAARHAYRRRKQATTHKHAGSKATNPNTLFQALCLRRPFTRERVKPPPLFEIILPLNYFPSGGFGFRRYLSRYDSLRVFTLWHGGHNHCRLLNSSVPPLARLMMWSSSKGSPSPQCAHWYGSWYLACCLIFLHAPVDVRLLPFSHAIYIIPMLS